MAHSTPCYKNLYAITRFHLFFFTGRSLEEFAAALDFKVSGQSKGEFICYRFKPQTEAIRLVA